MKIKYFFTVIVLSFLLCDTHALVNESNVINKTEQKKLSNEEKREKRKKSNNDDCLMDSLRLKDIIIDSLKARIDTLESQHRNTIHTMEEKVMQYEDSMKKYKVKDELLSKMSDSERRRYCVRLTNESYDEEKVKYAIELCEKANNKVVFAEFKKLLEEYKPSRDEMISVLKDIASEEMHLSPSTYKMKSEGKIKEMENYKNRYLKRNEKEAYFIHFLDDRITEVLKRIKNNGRDANFEDIERELKGENKPKEQN